MNYMQAQRKNKIRFGEEGDALLMLMVTRCLPYQQPVSPPPGYSEEAGPPLLSASHECFSPGITFEP